MMTTDGDDAGASRFACCFWWQERAAYDLLHKEQGFQAFRLPHCGTLRDHGGASAAECGGSSLAFKMPFFVGIEIG